MTGRRVPDGELAENPFQPGAYGRVMVLGAWQWHAVTPNGHCGNLSAHDVVEHEDGTITVSPSIQVFGGPGGGEVWHGFLERGVWRDA